MSRKPVANNDASITAFCKEHITSYKRPLSYEVRDELPMSGADKLLRFKLRDEHWKGRGRNIG